jgi:hypothetical protein
LKTKLVIRGYIKVISFKVLIKEGKAQIGPSNSFQTLPVQLSFKHTFDRMNVEESYIGSYFE